MTRNKNGSLSDDRGEMKNNTPFAERDADAAVSGRIPADPELAAVQRALSHMKEALVMEPRTEVISTHAAQFAAAVPPTSPMPEVRTASPWRRRAAAAIAIAAVSGFGVAGAAAADEAAPGDALYGLDQALESVGILDGGTPERFHEAGQLAREGDIDGAMKLAGHALESDGEGDAATGLRNAADAVAKNSSGDDDVRLQVSAMLQWMADQDTRGAEFGAAVSERARAISGNANENANKNSDKVKNENANENATKNADKTVNENANENATKSADETANDNADPSGTGDGTVPETPNENALTHESSKAQEGAEASESGRP